MAFQRADPALVGQEHGDRFLLDQRRIEINVDVRCVRERGAATAERGFLGVALAGRLHLFRDALPLQVVGLQQRLKPLALLRQLVVLALDLHLLELGQALQTQIEDRVGLHLRELEFAHQLGLRIILEADDPDHLVEVEVGDQVAVEHFQPVLDLFQPEPRAANEHLDAVLEPLLQHILQ